MKQDKQAKQSEQKTSGEHHLWGGIAKKKQDRHWTVRDRQHHHHQLDDPKPTKGNIVFKA
jgi:hypothetical protein